MKFVVQSFQKLASTIFPGTSTVKQPADRPIIRTHPLINLIIKTIIIMIIIIIIIIIIKTLFKLIRYKLES